MQVLTRNDIRIVQDHRGVEVAVIPDAAAVEMRRQVNRGWYEYPGQGLGRSRMFTPGTWTHDSADQIIQAFGESPVPDNFTGERRRRAELARQRARDYGQTAGALWIVGESGWDDEARAWRWSFGSSEQQNVVVPHFPNRECHVDLATDERTEGIQWHG